MARGGGHHSHSSHHSSHHSHHSYHRHYYRSRSSFSSDMDDDSPDFVRSLLFVIIVYFVISAVSIILPAMSRIRQGLSTVQPLHVDRDLEFYYCTDQVGALTGDTEGLEYELGRFYGQTGVIPYLFFTDSNTYYYDQSLSTADRLYDDLFSDEKHLLFIFSNTESFQWNITYYYGSEVDRAIRQSDIEKALDHLDAKLLHNSNEEALRSTFSFFTSQMADAYSSGNHGTTLKTIFAVLMVCGLAAVLIVLVLHTVRSKNEQERLRNAAKNPDMYKAVYDDLVLDTPAPKPLNTVPLEVRQPKKALMPKIKQTDDTISLDDALSDIGKIITPTVNTTNQSNAQTYMPMTENNFYSEHRKPFTSTEKPAVSEKPPTATPKMRSFETTEVTYTRPRRPAPMEMPAEPTAPIAAELPPLNFTSEPVDTKVATEESIPETPVSDIPAETIYNEILSEKEEPTYPEVLPMDIDIPASDTFTDIPVMDVSAEPSFTDISSMETSLDVPTETPVSEVSSAADYSNLQTIYDFSKSDPDTSSKEYEDLSSFGSFDTQSFDSLSSSFEETGSLFDNDTSLFSNSSFEDKSFDDNSLKDVEWGSIETVDLFGDNKKDDDK